MSNRRRSSAATRPAPAPPPSGPIPKIPIPPLPDSPEVPRQVRHNDELDDPPPPSILHLSGPSVEPPDPPRDPPREFLLPEARPEPRIPSSRRALTRALELAREAVQLDSTNEEPYAAVTAYGRSVALLSEVMERVRRGEDSTDSRRRHGRPRSAVAQEEEIRRLQNIHDTYADRMNILSIIYNIPPAPYSANAEYAAMLRESTPSTFSPTGSQSVMPESVHSSVGGSISSASDAIPPEDEYQDDHSPARNPFDTGHDRDLNEAGMFLFENERGSQAPISHPYAAVYEEALPPATSSGIRSRRPRNTSAAAFAPPPPPPSNALPPAPVPASDEISAETTGEHRRTHSASRLAALEEEVREDRGQTRAYVPDRVGESPPLPPLPSPTRSRPPVPVAAPIANVITPRPRGSSYISPRTEVPPSGVINGTINQGTIFHRRSTKSSAPPSTRSSSPAESTTSAGSNTVAKSLSGRSRSVSQPGRRPSLINGRISPALTQPPPPLPSTNGTPSILPRKPSFASKLNPNNPLFVHTDLPLSSTLGPPIFNQLPTTPTSPLPPAPPTDPIRKPYHMMSLLRTTMISATGGYVTRRLHVPQGVWSQGGAKLTNVSEKIRVVAILCSALEELQTCSSEHFGAGNVSSGMGLGIGSIGRTEGEAWIGRLEEFSNICDGVVANFGKKLGVGEGFVVKKSSWGGKLTRQFDKFTAGKNLDSPAAYVSGLQKLFLYAQLLDEHSQAITSQPVAAVYAALPADIRTEADKKLKRSSQFFATVVLTFVIRDLSLLLDKYAKKCEKWLAE
ncbi:unnamed protein product [Mycena citricolor]|uniref:MIT domain-containing protein n=1 Tax=Mycena citricolor TaxID=2018698 RepID=A0AAD2H054_9AGAR|nr:unnamed protein product [Mycena citricolor]